MPSTGGGRQGEGVGRTVQGAVDGKQSVLALLHRTKSDHECRSSTKRMEIGQSSGPLLLPPPPAGAWQKPAPADPLGAACHDNASAL